jgi:membrane-bound lytic murein transglycosylase D
LVIAAYNSGPGKVTRAIALSGHDNFWQLQNFLPRETRNHVKRFVSVMYYFEEQNYSTQQQNSL